MGFLDFIKKHINNYKINQEKERIEEYNKKRDYAINRLNHTWTKEEHESYDNWYTIESCGNFGGYTSGEYQREILSNYANYLKKDEIEEFRRVISLRIIEEKKENLENEKIKLESKILKLDKEIANINKTN